MDSALACSPLRVRRGHVQGGAGSVFFRTSPRNRCPPGGCQRDMLTAVIFSVFLPITSRAGAFSRCRRALRRSPPPSASPAFPRSLGTSAGRGTRPELRWGRETARRNVSLRWQPPQAAFMPSAQRRSPNPSAEKKRKSPAGSKSRGLRLRTVCGAHLRALFHRELRAAVERCDSGSGFQSCGTSARHTNTTGAALCLSASDSVPRTRPARN